MPEAPTNLLGLDAARAWDTDSAFKHLQSAGHCDSKRTAERRLQELAIVAPPLEEAALRNERGDAPTRLLLDWELGEARTKRRLVLFLQLHALPTKQACLCANDARGANFWVPLGATQPDADTITRALAQLHALVGKPIAALPHGALVAYTRSLRAPDGVTLHQLFHHPVPEVPSPKPLPRRPGRSHLDRLEDESIHILREAVAESEKPVMLYSIGKDSSVMVHLARKAFFPAPPPFPLMHIDTRWKFREMYFFRETMAQLASMRLIRFVNPEAVERDINPFDHGSSLHTHVTKTEGLKKALDEHGFDLAFGGARRDEEKSRAKERVFSFRTSTHRWDPKNQRPELWNLYNAQKAPGESIRVFPLSNWTELDVWEYILREGIPVVPLYFAKERPVVERDGALIMVDDDRMRLLPGERIERRTVRFRTLGCYPLSGAIESEADSLEAIMAELIAARTSERQGRVIDHDQAASMEKKKHEGYF
ncbi:MAG: sulfate adenylyltransferase subunit CysD [Planctomycetota bacterium]